MVILRGDVFWADLGEPQGSEPAKYRPILVVQDDSYNRSAINTILAVTLSSQTHLADFPGNVFLSREVTGLPKDSVANVSQLVTLNKFELVDRVGRVPSDVMGSVSRGLARILGL